MKKYLLLSAILLATPFFAFGAYDDVSLTTDAVISVGGENYTVYGSTALLQSITVDTSSFGVTMAAGSTLTVYSSTNRTFTASSDPAVTTTPSCVGAYSTLTLTATGVATITVTPSGFCSYGGGGSSDGGGSPAPAPAPAPTPIATTTTTTTATTTAVVATTTTTVIIRGPLLTKTLQLGSTDPEVIALQQFFIDLGILVVPSTIPLGYFGPLTTDAVIKFQKMALLDPAGIVGPKTREALAATSTTATLQSSSIPAGFLFARPLKIGSSGPDVAVLQQILIAKGFLVFNARAKPGYFGGLTRIAVIQFQKSLGLEPVGSIGPLTRKALNKITGAL
ncbi:MAG: peptidoglycan-binding protein [bacterium]|nr:peptidoglycan-binding protein [bacterium]